MVFQFSPSSPAGKWLGFVTAIWVQAIAGNNYTFSNYSDALKTLMGLSQLQLNNLSVAKDIGKAFGLVSGLASDRLSPSMILLIGSLEGLVGYGAQWLVVSQKISPLPYWQMCVFLCLGGNSTTWMNTAILVTCMRNFRKNRGPVSGILKGFLGLSTAIFTDICTALFSAKPSPFLLMLAIVPAVICFISMLFLREIPENHRETPEEQNEETRYFSFFNVIAIVTAAYLLAFDISGKHDKFLSQAFAVVLLLLLASPLGVPLYAALKSSERRSSDLEFCEPLLISTKTEQNEIEEKEEEHDLVQSKPVIGEEHTIWQTIRTIDFWIVFISFLCGVGTGMAVMNNMGQMGLALGYADVSIFISLISIWGFFGRIVSGFVSEFYIKKYGTPRPIWNAASQVLMTAGYIVMAIGLPGSLHIGSIVVGICYGVRLAVTVPISSEMFGLKYYGLIYNILILNLPLGSFLFSGLLAGYMYDSEATKTADGGTTCVGAHCYRVVFIVMAMVCIVGFVLDILLVFRTRNLYTKIHESKNLRREAKKEESIKS